MKTDKPLVSICIPTYNGELFIEECLTSAIHQTYDNLEIIVSDDASSDNTLSIVNTLKQNTDIPIHVFNHKPSGIGANWNNCVKHAKGDYIKFLFQDDMLYPNCIETLMALMASETNVGMVYAKRKFIYKEKTESISQFEDFYGDLHLHWSEIEVIQGVLDGRQYLKDKSFLNAPKNKIGEPTSVLLSKQCFEKVGYFRQDLKQALDCEFWYRLMPFYKIGFVDEVLSSFRLHDVQASAINKSKKINETETLYNIYYNSLLPYLHILCRRKLQKRFHPIISRLYKLKVVLRGLITFNKE